ncbi:hypothetical protein G7Y79_00042g078470 [Physcia stellaris]|nr:hypothetical protein G7Y79_00042g078470 [Physcia stellaris]
MASQAQKHEESRRASSCSQVTAQADDPQAVAAARTLLALYEEDKAQMKAVRALLSLQHGSGRGAANPVEEGDGDQDREGAHEEAETHEGQEPLQFSETKGGQESQEELETEEEDWSNPSVLDYWRKRR